MTQSKILLVEPQPQLLEMLLSAVSHRFDTQVTCVADAKSCLDVEMIEPHDIVVTEIDLPGASGLKLARDLTALSSRPVILMGDDVECGEVISAMRIGVRDVFQKPFPVDELLLSIHRLISGHQIRRQHAAKYHRMRELVRKVIKERRGLNRRVELLCRDFIGAHRRLVKRVVTMQPSAQQPSS